MSEQYDNATPTTRNAKRRRGQKPTAEERREIQQKFLDSFKLNANVTLACLHAGIDRSQIYRWQEHDERFSHEFKQAELSANDMLLAAAWRRSVDGTEKPVVSMGKQVFVSEEVDGQIVSKPLMERVYSDALLSLLMKARMREYRDNKHVDLTTNTNTKDMLSLHETIAQALSQYPEAKVAVAAALAEMGKDKERGN